MAYTVSAVLVAGGEPDRDIAGVVGVPDVQQVHEDSRYTFPYAASDGYEPTPTPTPTMTPTPTATPVPTVPAFPATMTESEMRALYAYAGVPSGWVEPLLAIAWCESRFNATAVGDHGNSLGLHQLWTGWFGRAGYSVEQWDDPVVNTKVAIYVRETRGRFGGSGGWTCANMLGIY